MRLFGRVKLSWNDTWQDEFTDGRAVSPFASSSLLMDCRAPLTPADPARIAKEVMMSKSNPIYIELVYVLLAVVVALAIRVNLPKPSAPELVAVPCACMEI
jgi:hypothetical protein